jgi:Tfp pilus assembly protein PilF
MTRATLRVFFGLGAALALSACGPDPEPATAATPPPTTATTTVATGPATPPAGSEPSAEQRKEAARAAFAAKDYAKARSELDAVLAKNPNDVDALKLLSDVHAAQGDAPGTTDALLRATKADNGKDEILALAAAKHLYDARRYDDAITVTQLATKANDKSVPAWMYMGLAQIAKEDYAAASETYAKLTTAMPDEPLLWAELAANQAAAGKADDAKKSAKTALEKWTDARNPKSTKDIKFGKGAEEIVKISRAYRRAGDAKAAEGALGKYTVAKDETAPQVDVERGLLRVASKDGKGALAAATKAKAAKGDGYAPAHLVEAGAAAVSKKSDEAKTHLAMYDQGATPDLAWERKWIETLAAGAPAAPAGDTKAGDTKAGDTKGGTGAPKPTPAPKK